MKRNFIAGYWFQAFNIAFTMIVYPFFLKHLGAENYGVWSMFIAILGSGSILVQGVGTGVVKITASNIGKFMLK